MTDFLDLLSHFRSCPKSPGIEPSSVHLRSSCTLLHPLLCQPSTPGRGDGRGGEYLGAGHPWGPLWGESLCQGNTHMSSSVSKLSLQQLSCWAVGLQLGLTRHGPSMPTGNMGPGVVTPLRGVGWVSSSLHPQHWGGIRLPRDLTPHHTLELPGLSSTLSYLNSCTPALSKLKPVLPPLS